MKNQRKTTIHKSQKSHLRKNNHAQWVSIDRDWMERIIYTYLVLNPRKKTNWVIRPMTPKQFYKEIWFAEQTIQNMREKWTASKKTVQKIKEFAVKHNLDLALERVKNTIRKKV